LLDLRDGKSKRGYPELVIDVAGSRQRVPAMHGYDFPAADTIEARELLCSPPTVIEDWRRHGPVDRVIPYASMDSSARSHAVHLDALATATDGHRMLRLPMSSSYGQMDVLVTPHAARLVIAMVEGLPPEQLRTYVSRSTDGERRVWFIGSCAGGTVWQVATRALKGPPPDYETAKARLAQERMVITVDVKDLAEFAATHDYVAFSALGNLLGWSELRSVWSYGKEVLVDEGIGTTFESASERAEVVVQGKLLGQVLRTLPRSAPRVKVEIAGHLDVVLIEEALLMPVRIGDGIENAKTVMLPERVKADLVASFEDTLGAYDPARIQALMSASEEADRERRATLAARGRAAVWTSAAAPPEPPKVDDEAERRRAFAASLVATVMVAPAPPKACRFDPKTCGCDAHVEARDRARLAPGPVVVTAPAAPAAPKPATDRSAAALKAWATRRAEAGLAGAPPVVKKRERLPEPTGWRPTPTSPADLAQAATKLELYSPAQRAWITRRLRSILTGT
jgi:hypothetical protein